MWCTVLLVFGRVDLGLRSSNRIKYFFTISCHYQIYITSAHPEREQSYAAVTGFDLLQKVFNITDKILTEIEVAKFEKVLFLVGKNLDSFFCAIFWILMEMVDKLGLKIVANFYPFLLQIFLTN